MDIGLTGKYALVTGGSRGIGFAIASKLYGMGAEVYICGRNVKSLVQAAKDMGEIGAFPCDVTDKGDVKELFRKIKQLDILVNNAGGMEHFNSFDDCKTDDWRSTFELNLFSAVEVSKAALPLLRKSKGCIINIASEVGKQPFRMGPDYCASKAALLSFSKSLSNELAPEGIRVNAVCPGAVLTDSWKKEAATPAQLQKNIDRAVEGRIPLGRIGRPEDVAGMVAFLATPSAAWITGGTFSVDGGAVQSIM